jgi:AraC-like DNA-binding protein
MANPPCNNDIKGVLHLSSSEQHYQLSRAIPCSKLKDIVEQYWFVSWDLRQQPPHVQKNLPDPCVNLFFDEQGAKLLGAVSKVYTYKMQGVGHVFGIKFMPSGFCSYTKKPMSSFAEQYSEPKTVFQYWGDDVLDDIKLKTSLSDAIAVAEPLLLANITPATEKQQLTNAIVSFIKQSPHVTHVNQIAAHFEINVRALQRLFERYVGLSPKWVIRKYRLHEVLDNAENNKQDWLATSMALGYTDQAHFIKDFKDIIGVTPSSYLEF